MYRRVLPFVTIVAILACNPENGTQPPPPLPSSGSPVISDGAHTPGNPDFFFLNPMVPKPDDDPAYGDAFNGSLVAMVSICELQPDPTVSNPLGSVDDTDVVVGTPCRSSPPGYALPPTAATVDVAAEKYQFDWTVPVSEAVYYRITVKVGSVTLGFADVKTGPNANALKNTDLTKFVTRNDGSSLPIKFRIEEFALCPTPGTGPCASESVDLNTGGTVQTTFPGDLGPSGIEIKPGSGTTSHVVTVSECPATETLEARIDLPTFGRCARVTLDPPLAPNETFDVPAIAFICSAPAAVNAALSDLGQRTRVTMHRFDANPDRVAALPHAFPDACDPPPSFAAAQPTLKGMLVDLVRGRFKSAGGQLVGMFSPRPLYATMMLDEGGGGETGSASDFQFALPAKMEKVASTDNQVAPPGLLPTNPKVIVTDLAGIPVANARVRFGGATESACLALPVSGAVLTSGVDGSASAPWTIVAGPNSLVACGRGIADADEATNGPRTGAGAFDPFQPIQTPFDPGPDPNPLLEEPVLPGSVTFSATGYLPEPVSAGGFDFGEDGYSSMQLAQNAPAPAGWETPAFIAGANGFTVGTGAPFGTGTGCGLGTLDTPWALNTDILVRKKFSLSMAATLNIRVSVDNDLVDIYLNGVKLNGATLQHEGCAVPGNDVHDFEFAAAGIAGTNTLAIRARDRGGESYLNVTAIPTPILAFTGSEPGLVEGTRKYNLAVTNSADYPTALFVASPSLPACGLNTSASRTWVDIFDGNDDSRLYGFCALGNPSDLQYLWFASSATEPTTPVYIKLIDRKYVGSGTVDRLFYQSNSVAISPPPP